ncbi:MAG: hypothetical protein IT539_00400 [Bradyrhizobiaceae bacterium]|nr:hypothetical protein [Bradyrhizobiaceae bacterium]
MRKFLRDHCSRSRREIIISAALLLLTTAAFVLFFVQNYLNVAGVLTKYTNDSTFERALYTTIFAIFMYGSLAYQISRLSFFWNLRNRTRAAWRGLKQFLRRDKATKPRVEILVPCYQEESHVIFQTLLSAALVDYPGRGVVLLLDNSPKPANEQERALLLSGRAQVEVIRDLLEPIGVRFNAKVAEVRAGIGDDGQLRSAMDTAATLYDEAADFLETLARRVAAGDFGGPDDHTRKFFIERILLEPAGSHRRRAARLRVRAPKRRTIETDLSRLEEMFKVRLSGFERKRFVNLSHAANKAANLNSYLSIMGRRLCAVSGPGGLELVEADAVSQDGAFERIEPADADYVIILDADSFLLPEYANCMVSALESPENARAAVAQTPYTAIPGTPHVLERVAGATTDIYYYVTEGMGFLNAGFWVGASATIRKVALLDIAHTIEERGYRFPAYIQEKTVIEDTAATVDLIRKNWSVHNYPARLSFSATPADFGALVVQRRRWANGGLIVLPSLLGHIARARKSLRGIMEAILRIHYLVMPALISASMVLMLLYPFDFKRVSMWIYLTIPPYLYLVMRDLVHTGYRRRDLFGAYVLFLLLLPVVLTGVLHSIRQVIFGTKARFARTPKIEQRTAIPLTCIIVILGLFGWSLGNYYADIAARQGVHAVFAAVNAVALFYGITIMIGMRAIAEDIGWSVSQFFASLFRRPERLAPIATQPIATVQLIAPATEAPVPVRLANARNGTNVRLQRDVGRMIRRRRAALLMNGGQRSQRLN